MEKILVIDDEESVNEFVARVLREDGYEVLTAHRGEAALKMAASHRPDLIVCDVNMPDLNGYQVLDRLRANPELADIAFILMTGQADLHGMRQGLTKGADGYLPKPFDLAELSAVVATRLQKRRAARVDADRRLAELRVNISLMLPHELLTPLTGILGTAEFLAQEADTLKPEEVAEFGQSIQAAGNRLHQLIKNFLVYAQIELLAADAGKVAALRQGQAAEVGVTLQPIAKQKAEAWKRPTDLVTSLPPIKVGMSEQNLAKIAEELLDNAFKFSDAGTPVEIRAVVQVPNAVISVSDRGRGMSPEYVAQIGAYAQFERRIYEQQGSGLGLIIAKRLTELYGGRFTIESQPGKGTTVRAEIPLVVG